MSDLILPGDVQSRQSQLIHPDARDASVVIAGAGMLGSWTAHALVRMCAKVTVYDGQDTVEAVNIGNQAYNGMNVEQQKGEALGMALYGLPFEPVPLKFPPDPSPITSVGPVNVVVSCVDNLKDRALIAQWAFDHRADLFIDTRAQEEVACIATVPFNTEELKKYLDAYLENLPNDSQVDDVACGMTGTAYVGMWVASQVACHVNNHYKGLTNPGLLVYHVGQRTEVTRQTWEEVIAEQNTTE